MRSDLHIQQSLAVYLLPYAIMTLWHGAISDSIGRITTIKWGLGIFVLASIGCAFAPNVETLWFFRALQGASGGAGNTVARAMVRDLFEGAQAQRVMATVQMLFGYRTCSCAYYRRPFAGFSLAKHFYLFGAVCRNYAMGGGEVSAGNHAAGKTTQALCTQCSRKLQDDF